jgi:hypothetical protein
MIAGGCDTCQAFWPGVPELGSSGQEHVVYHENTSDGHGNRDMKYVERVIMGNMHEPGEPIEGQSHWCDWSVLVTHGRRRTELIRCHNIVRNDSDHCEAGHPNEMRSTGVTLTSKVDESIVADPVRDSCEVEDLASVPEASRTISVRVHRGCGRLTGFSVGTERHCGDVGFPLCPGCWARTKSEPIEEGPGGAEGSPVTERLREQCRAHAGGATCAERDIPCEDRCERCLAADEIEALRDVAEDAISAIEYLQQAYTTSTYHHPDDTERVATLDVTRALISRGLKVLGQKDLRQVETRS